MNENTPTVQHLYKYSKDYLKEKSFEQLLEGKKIEWSESFPEGK